MEKLKKIINNKIFLVLLSFLLTTLTLKFVGDIGWIFMLYPLTIVLVSMTYGFILNPLRERKELKKYLNYKGVLKGTIKSFGKPLSFVKVSIYNPLNQFDIDTSKYYTISDVNGNFTIPHVKDGEFICFIKEKDYEIFSKKFTMSNSQTVEINVELIKE